ncbi:MAG: hypothetical protein H6Q05_2611 [Acidobacteria bacterium]|jgi:uncharacterized SAM-binding protein YcdF (DUF218 family)|nr:hypothetical protein [Acidobacteriota bacterium]
MILLKQLLAAAFSPVGITTLLLAVGLLMRLSRRMAHGGRRCMMAGAALYCFLILTPFSEIVVARLEREYAPLLRVGTPTGIRNIVVLSGYGEDDAFLPVTSKLRGDTIQRLVEGMRLARELPGARLLMSGGVQREGDPPVASLMADFAKSMGVPGNDIAVEAKSHTTYENLAETRQLIGTEPFILVTSAYHLPRAMAVARKLGMNPLAAPAAIWASPDFPPGMSWKAWGKKVAEKLIDPSTNRLVHLQLAYHEYLGYLWYKILGRV